MTRKYMKWSGVVDHLANDSIEDYEPSNLYFLDEDMLVAEKKEENEWWTMCFDRIVHVSSNGVGVVIISLKRKQYPIVVKL